MTRDDGVDEDVVGEDGMDEDGVDEDMVDEDALWDGNALWARVLGSDRSSGGPAERSRGGRLRRRGMKKQKRAKGSIAAPSNQ